MYGYRNGYSLIFADIFGRSGNMLSFFLRNRSHGMITSIKEEGHIGYSFAKSIEFHGGHMRF
jgi:hypothetical protein